MAMAQPNQDGGMAGRMIAAKTGLVPAGEVKRHR